MINAFSIEEARQLFLDNPDIDLIVMDACVDSNSIDTEPLVEDFRRIFKGPMIVSTTSFSFAQRLIRAGCDHECEKHKVPKKVLELLGFQ